MAHRVAKPIITPNLVLRAYAMGLFPMAESSDDPDLFWVDPEERGIFPLDGIVVSKSLAKAVRSDRFRIAVDQDFSGVLDGCAAAAPDRPQTWINGRIRALYGDLHAQGFVHTVEAYHEDRLVGGLYGLALGAAFFGESMFHRERDASKVCLVHLAARLRAGRYRLLDTQFVTPHLATLGAIAVTRADYRARLAVALSLKGESAAWSRTPRSGETALRALATPG